MNNDLILKREYLPNTVEGLNKWRIIGKEMLKAHKAKVRAADLTDAKEAKEAALDDAQDLADVLLDAEMRLGELLKVIEPNREKESSSQRTSLSSLPPGIDKRTSHIAQTLASHPEIVERAKAEARERDEIPTTATVYKLIKKDERYSPSNTTDVVSSPCAVSDLHSLAASGKKFKTILADPPWAYSNQATRAATNNHYDTMTVEDICALPVKELADECAHLHLWTTNAFLFEAPQIMDAWGFEYKSCLLWIKPTMGIGNYWRVSHEFMLLGVKGSLPFNDHSEMSWYQEKRSSHSTKPIEIISKIEKVSPGPYLELFARETRSGWTSWGNQISRTLFNEAAFNG